MARRGRRGASGAVVARPRRSSATAGGDTCISRCPRGPGELEHIARRVRDLDAAPRGPVEHEGGDRSLYVEDPEGNLVEVWEFFVDGDGAREGVAPLADDQSAAASA